MPPSISYNCYIDEAGDEGFRFDKGSSPWFFLTAIIVKAVDDPAVRGTVDALLQRLWLAHNQRPPTILHWRNLNHHRKVAVANAFAAQPICQVTVGLWKARLKRASFINRSDYLFRYATRFLLERASWCVRENNGFAQVVFSNRNRFELGLLRDYIAQVLTTKGHQIRGVFDVDQIEVRNPAQMKMLQIADAGCSAVYDAFCPDPYGNIHPYYLQIIKGRLYRRGGSLYKYGLKLLPDAAHSQEGRDAFPFLADLE